MSQPQPVEQSIPMRVFLERIIDEHDRLYDSRFRASEIAVQAALLAQKEAVANAFLASEKAIIKAEEAQLQYNQRSNEFRGQLDDQAKLLMSRAESLGLFRSSDDKIETMRLFFDSKLESQRLAFEKSISELSDEVGKLREFQSNILGRITMLGSALGFAVIVISIAVSVILHNAK
jgi:hypothetical protein